MLTHIRTYTGQRDGAR